MSFIPVTEEDRKQMLQAIGVSGIDDLFKDIPGDILLKQPLDLPEPLTESAVMRHMNDLSEVNCPVKNFAGAGAYEHYVPAAVDYLSSRSEFYTAYTPYQPEVSQGTLGAIFEFQTMMCRLTGMDLSNASMYDGATAMTESVIMACGVRRRNRVVISEAVHPHYRAVLDTYAWAAGIEVVTVAAKNGLTDAAALKAEMNDTVAAVVIQTPNFFGSIEDLRSFEEAVHEQKAVFITVVTEAMSLGLIAPPGEAGADVVCGEAQSFGNYIGYGGPMLGFIASTKEFMRRIPGRLVGATTDETGRSARVLTLQTREQHIRRERATSNICTNEGLLALRAVIYLSLAGPKLKEIASLNHALAGKLKQALIGAGLVPVFDAPCFNEFVMRVPGNVSIQGLEAAGFLPGIDLGEYYDDLKGCRLFCATEAVTPADIENFAAAMADETGTR